jgi:NADH-quinone oxidoreductase subunit M
MIFEQFPILSFMTFMPLIGALLILFMRGDDKAIRNNVVNVGALVSFAVFVVSIAVLFKFDKTEAGFQFVEEYVWFEQLNLTYKMGVDGISIFFV